MTDPAPQVTQQDGVTLIQLGAEFENLDERLLDKVRNPLLETAQNAEPPCLLLDLSQTKFFGSAFIEIMFRMANRLKQRKGKFALSGLTPYCAEILHVTHIDTLWPIYPEAEAGVAGMKSTT